MNKRLFDLAGAGAGLVLLSPLLLASAVWIKLDSAGPVFVREQRVGRGGVLFRVIGFRTTLQESDGPLADAGERPAGLAHAGGSGTRQSRAGRVLRRYDLDKLPQLLNVLQGAMSLVGPAPALPDVIATYPPQLRALALSFTPGIMDWTSVLKADEQALLRGAADPEQVFLESILPTRLEYYGRYAQQRSLWLDLRIILHSMSVPAD